MTLRTDLRPDALPAGHRLAVGRRPGAPRARSGASGLRWASLALLLLARPPQVAAEEGGPPDVPPAKPGQSLCEGSLAAGRDHLVAGRFEAALPWFEAAIIQAPVDPRGYFFLGLTLNRVGRHQAALEALQRAVLHRYRSPELGFEMGWSAVGLQRWDDAAETLEAFESASPGRGLTSLLRGQAYLGRGAFDEASAALQEAARRDPALEPLARYHEAEVLARRGRAAEAEAALAALAKDHPDAPLARWLGATAGSRAGIGKLGGAGLGAGNPGSTGEASEASARADEAAYPMARALGRTARRLDAVAANGSLPADFTGYARALLPIVEGAGLAHAGGAALGEAVARAVSAHPEAARELARSAAARVHFREQREQLRQDEVDARERGDALAEARARQQRRALEAIGRAVGLARSAG